MEITVVTEPDEIVLRAVRALLDRAFDGRFDDHDWAHTCGGAHALVHQSGSLVAHAAVVERSIEIAGVGRRVGYVEGVAVEPSVQGTGVGTVAMQAIGDVVRDRFELGVLSTGATGFYERLGWERWRGPSAVRRRDGTLETTPDDDDGIMILRTPASSEFRPPLDVTSTIVCDDRAGDAW